MISTNLVQFGTPKGLLLNGFWFGPVRPKTVYILIHGLTSNAFANHPLVLPLVDTQTSVLTFSNRGSEKITRFKKRDLRKKKGYGSITIGEAHEVFTDCVDDIAGAVAFAKKQGSERIILIGHSTGCQKSIYYLSKRNIQKNIQGVVLLAPMSDYAGAKKSMGTPMLQKAVEYAHNLIACGKPHELIPLTIWPLMHDAQRFISLYTPESSEEIFCYADPHKRPSTLQKVTIPQLILLAGNDEFRDRPVVHIAKWFEKRLRRKNRTIHVIKNAPHNFFKYEKKVVEAVLSWTTTL